jgi:acetyl-CoA C-acetyltransferase
MNSNNAVEQGAGLVVTSVERAEALGVPRDRWVFPLAGTEAHDHYAVSHRADLRSSPAIRLAGRALFELAGVGVDDVAHVDLYSCFPSAVQVGAAELGLGLDRDLTVTGGLSFAGGPWNNYVSHSVATMVRVLRADPGTIGLVTANGGYITKHALTLYSTEPPAGGFRWASVQDEVDALPRREVAEQLDSGQSGEIESWVVGHDRENRPERAVAAVILDDGRRAWADSVQPDTLAELTSGAEQIGRSVKLTPEGQLLL